MRPLVIAHRGASGLRPEHTRAAYELAIDQGCDFIEPDLVMTADGHLVVRHENEVGGTTDVAARPEFAARRTEKQIDGLRVEGWFTEDFTLAELKTLETRERLADLRLANTAFDGSGEILTFQEVLDIAREAKARTRRVIGVCPELKHPTWFRSLGFDMETAFVAVLQANGLTEADSPILIQCFEAGTLQTLRNRISAPLLQLIAAGPNAGPMISPEGLSGIAAYADYIGVETTLIEPRDSAGAALPPSSLIADAQAAGLKVAAWTFRAENAFLPLQDRRGEGPAAHGDLTGQIERFRAYGLDAVFSDFPDVAAAVRRAD